MNNLGDSVRSEIRGDVRICGLLVDIIDTGESLDFSVPRSLVESSSVDLLAVLQWGSDVDEEVVSALSSNSLLDSLSRLLVWRSRGGNDGGTCLGEFGSDETDSEEVLVLVFVGDTKVGRELVSNVFTQKEGDGTGTVLLEGNLEGTGNGVLSGVVQTRQQDWR